MNAQDYVNDVAAAIGEHAARNQLAPAYEMCKALLSLEDAKLLDGQPFPRPEWDDLPEGCKVFYETWKIADYERLT